MDISIGCFCSFVAYPTIRFIEDFLEHDALQLIYHECLYTYFHHIYRLALGNHTFAISKDGHKQITKPSAT